MHETVETRSALAHIQEILTWGLGRTSWSPGTFNRGPQIFWSRWLGFGTYDLAFGCDSLQASVAQVYVPETARGMCCTCMCRFTMGDERLHRVYIRCTCLPQPKSKGTTAFPEDRRDGWPRRRFSPGEWETCPGRCQGSTRLTESGSWCHCGTVGHPSSSIARGK